jgi:hypothetical protein
VLEHVEADAVDVVRRDHLRELDRPLFDGAFFDE